MCYLFSSSRFNILTFDIDLSKGFTINFLTRSRSELPTGYDVITPVEFALTGSMSIFSKFDYDFNGTSDVLLSLAFSGPDVRFCLRFD